MIEFQEGDECYVRGKRPDQKFVVVERLNTESGWPHFILRDKSGRRWRVSKLQMSSKPIKDKK